MTLALLLNRPADAYLDAQRHVHLERMRQLNGRRRTAPLVDQLLIDHARLLGCRLIYSRWYAGD